MFVQNNLSENDALSLEQQLISTIGTKWTISGVPCGPLCNMTSGGEGTTPYEELKDKFRNVGECNGMFGKQYSADARQKISDFRNQLRYSDETKQRMAQVRPTGDNHNE